jgi:hypothetical protein
MYAMALLCNPAVLGEFSGPFFLLSVYSRLYKFELYAVQHIPRMETLVQLNSQKFNHFYVVQWKCYTQGFNIVVGVPVMSTTDSLSIHWLWPAILIP